VVMPLLTPSSSSTEKANQAAKKRRAENEGILKRLRYLLLISNIAYILLRIVWMNELFGLWHAAGFGVCLVTDIVLFLWISSLAKPTFNESGELIDGGADLSTHGQLSEYAFDVLYIIAFVQITTIFSDYFWLVLLVIPLFAGYKLFSLLFSVGGGLGSADNAAQRETRDERRKREKMEKKMNRPKFQKIRK